jgi:hypothetical protein
MAMAMTTSMSVKPANGNRARRNLRPGVLQLFKRTFMIEFSYEGTTADLRRHSAPSFQLSNTCLSVSYTKHLTFSPSAKAETSPGKSRVYVWDAAFVEWDLRNARTVFEAVLMAGTAKQCSASTWRLWQSGWLSRVAPASGTPETECVFGLFISRVCVRGFMNLYTVPNLFTAIDSLRPNDDLSPR